MVERILQLSYVSYVLFVRYLSPFHLSLTLPLAFRTNT